MAASSTKSDAAQTVIAGLDLDAPDHSGPGRGATYALPKDFHKALNAMHTSNRGTYVTPDALTQPHAAAVIRAARAWRDVDPATRKISTWAVDGSLASGSKKAGTRKDGSTTVRVGVSARQIPAEAK